MKNATQRTTAPCAPVSDARNWSAPYYVKACALGIPAYLIGVHLWTWVLTYSLFIGGRADFRQLYAAGYMVRTGHRYELYDYDLQKPPENLLSRPYNHPSYEALIFVPLSCFSYREAYSIFLGINVLLLAFSFLLLRPWTGNLARVYWLLPAALFAAFLPIAAALIQGQDSIMLLALFAGAFVLLQKRREIEAGVFIGLASFKFQIAIPIALLFLIWRRWRFVTGFAASATAALATSILLVGIAQMKFYAHSLLSMSARATAFDYVRNAISPNNMPNIRGLIFGLANNYIPSSWVQAVICLLSAALVAWVAAKNQVRQGSGALLVAIPAAALVSYHFLIHDLSILLVPLVFALNRFLVSEPDGPRGEKLVERSAALAFCAPLAESFFPGHFYLVSVPILAFLVVCCREYRRENFCEPAGERDFFCLRSVRN
jgi:Glycosyltransferase family 87